MSRCPAKKFYDKMIFEFRDPVDRMILGLISPNDFLKLALPIVPDIETVDRYQDKINSNVNISIPYLIFNLDGKCLGHEGRHRMVAFNRLGYEQVPVMIRFSQNTNIYSEKGAPVNVYPRREIYEVFREMESRHETPADFRRNFYRILDLQKNEIFNLPEFIQIDKSGFAILQMDKVTGQI